LNSTQLVVPVVCLTVIHRTLVSSTRVSLMVSRYRLSPGDICRVISKSSTRPVNLALSEYQVSLYDSLTAESLYLIGCGANGGVTGEDVSIYIPKSCTVDIKGIDNHHVNDIGIGTVGGVFHTQRGPVIVIMHQYAL
jgi:hypothetical protein